MKVRPRIAVVSPFLDKRHGTERCVAELIERLAKDYDIHLYCGSVRDVTLSEIKWHRVSRLPGPHLIGYYWFLLANQFQRWWELKFQKTSFDLVFSPGINCLNSDVIFVHILFTAFRERMGERLAFRTNPSRLWPRLMLRRLAYACFAALEGRVYAREKLFLVVPSQRMANELANRFGRRNDVSVVYHGIDRQRFNPKVRELLRGKARCELKLGENDFALLLIGNDWQNKGLSSLVEALGELRNPSLRLLLVGNDDSARYESLLAHWKVTPQVRFAPSRPDVEFYYAAADAYVGPSLEDAFALPPLEAMACGLPVIVSRQAGVSELVTHGVDGFILEDPTSSEELAQLVRRVHQDPTMRQQLGARAAETAGQYTWKRNAEEMKAVFDKCLREKRGNAQGSKLPVVTKP